MPLEVTTYIVDPFRTTQTRRDRWDSAKDPARFDIRLRNAANLTGVVLTVQSPVPGAAAITVTAGVDFPNTAATLFDLAQLVLAAIDRRCGDLLSLRAPVTPAHQGVANQPGAAVYAPRPGAWGESITLAVNATANAANIVVNDTFGAGGHVQNAWKGASLAALDRLEKDIALLHPFGGVAPAFVSLEQVTLASGEVMYTLTVDQV